MDEFIKMDVFFMIASFATIVVTIIFLVLMIYVISFVRDLKYISKQAKIETDNIRQDIDDFRQGIKKEGIRLSLVTKFFNNIFKRNKKGK